MLSCFKHGNSVFARFDRNLRVVPVCTGERFEETTMGVQLQSALTILRRKQVETRTGLSRSTIYLRVADGSFPAPVKLGERAVGWVASEVDAFLARCVAQRDAKVAK